MLYIRLLTAVVIGLLACVPVHGQTSRVVTVPVSVENTTKPSNSFHLKGVLISKSSRLALVNGKSVQAGDRVAGVEILAINESGVRVHIGAQEFNVNIGGTIAGDPSARFVARKPRSTMERLHVVKSGETLSDIAQQYRRNDITRDQMMAALYHANAEAFDNNINRMFAGVTLRIPGSSQFFQRAPEIAATEVGRHMEIWQESPTPETEVAGKVTIEVLEEQYVQVESGDTLSTIAANVLRSGVTLDQMMIALYTANEHAFDKNINLLFAGTTLRVPDNKQLHDNTPNKATAEVIRQTRAWQDSFGQPEILAVAHSNLIAANKD